MAKDTSAPLLEHKPPVDPPVDPKACRLVELRPDQLVVSKLNPRDPLTVTPDTCADLVASIQSASGIITPLVVLPPKVEGGPYEVIAGSRRLCAAKHLTTPGVPGAMLDLKVPCVVRDIDALDASIIADVENAHRRDVSAVERAQGIARILKMNPDMSQDELARRLAERPATISNLISLAAWPHEVLAAYGSPHNVLLKDAERLAPSLRERTDKERDARDAVVARAKQVAAEQVRKAELNDNPIPRSEVTERLLRAGVGDVRRSLEIVDHRDKVIVALKRSRGTEIEVVVHGDGRPTPTVQAAFAQLLQEHRAKRSGRVPLKTEKPMEDRNAA